jgi:hypothetical protein
MARKRKSSEPPVISDHQSGVRSLIASSHGEEHVAYHSLQEAKFDPDGVVIFEGDYGGQIYLVARAQYVCCSEAQLQSLLLELDASAWADPEGTRVYFESLPVGTGVAGGMGGGTVAAEVWVHADLRPHEPAIRGVLLGKRASVKQ